MYKICFPTIRFPFFIATIFLSLQSCKKTDFDNRADAFTNYDQLQTQFFNTASADIEVQKIADNIKKQDSIFKFLPDFVRKNGIPKWDKTIYKITKNESSKQGDGLLTASGTSNTGTQGMFLIPLQRTSSSEIQAYISAYKHNDSLYTYRLYNRDSLDEIEPTSAEKSSNLLNIQAVFAVFERNVNGRDSFSIERPSKATIKNAAIRFDSSETSSDNQPIGSDVVNTINHCVFQLEIVIEYTLEIEVDGNTVYLFESVSVTMNITIDCFDGSGGGNCGCGTSDFYGGNDPSENWWTYGTGWPWYNTWNGYQPDDVSGWYWWWTAGGQSGGGNGFGAIVDWLSERLGLTWSQTYWLSQNPERADEIHNYLANNSGTEALQIAFDHVNAMMTNPAYLKHVENHAISGNPGQVWWEDDNWLGEGRNFSLDLEALGDNYGDLTAAEKALVKKYPVQAAILAENKATTLSISDEKMGGGSGINDKKDAFRHAFFQAINTMSVGATITKLFSDAHESEVPAALILERQMDLYNNDIGIATGLSTSFWTSVNELGNIVKGKIDNGDLRYLKPLDFASSPTYDANGDKRQDCPNCLNGIISTTVLTWTNQ